MRAEYESKKAFEHWWHEEGRYMVSLEIGELFDEARDMAECAWNFAEYVTIKRLDG